jgi:hypothetical protein
MRGNRGRGIVSGRFDLPEALRVRIPVEVRMNHSEIATFEDWVKLMEYLCDGRDLRGNEFVANRRTAVPQRGSDETCSLSDEGNEDLVVEEWKSYIRVN